MNQCVAAAAVRRKVTLLLQDGSWCKSVAASLSPSPLLTALNVLHPSSACWTSGEKFFFLLLLRPWKASVLCSRSVSAPHTAAHVVTRASSDPELPVCLLRYVTSIREIHILEETEWNLPSSDRWALRYAHSLTRKRLQGKKNASRKVSVKSVKVVLVLKELFKTRWLWAATRFFFFFSSVCPSLRRRSGKQQRCGPAPCLKEEEEEEEAPAEVNMLHFNLLCGSRGNPSTFVSQQI